MGLGSRVGLVWGLVGLASKGGCALRSLSCNSGGKDLSLNISPRFGKVVSFSNTGLLAVPPKIPQQLQRSPLRNCIGLQSPLK